MAESFSKPVSAFSEMKTKETAVEKINTSTSNEWGDFFCHVFFYSLVISL